MADSLWGTVVSVQANYYWVRLEPMVKTAVASPLNHEPLISASLRSGEQPSHLLCTRRARLKKTGQQVMVGDRVEVQEPDWQGQRGAIAAVAPRITALDRPPVANASQILLVFALAEPSLEPFQLSWFLVKAESTGMQICLALNKRDLVDAAAQAAWHQRLQRWGYDPLWLSVRNQSVPAALHQKLSTHITIVSGPSGVGKSSLINHLIPDLDLRVATVSGKLGRGRHTTRHVELFALPQGGFLADTPGFNQPDIDCAPEDLAAYFPEIRQRLAQRHCQFNNCLHQEEPGCVVRGDWERYGHYLQLLNAIAIQGYSQTQPHELETTMKYKVAGSGQLQAEPKLSAKKYRRVSRRSQNKALQDLCQELVDSADDLEALEGLSLDELL
ncbi:MAG: small ribosomal subunit biogenesis GTPase RsgA [Cyanobacteria bacterium J06639_16]